MLRPLTAFGSKRAERDAEFTTFVDQVGQRLLRTAIALTGSHDLGHELVQATLVKTYVAWPKMREGDPYAYARRIMFNERIDRWRATKHEVVCDVLPETASAPGTLTEDRDELVRLLATLPLRQRKVIVLRYYHDLSEKAVADVLGISVGAVKSAASRGLATLRSRNGVTDSKQTDSFQTGSKQAGAR